MLIGKNGKPLHGAAKQAVLNKHLGWQNDEIGVTLLSVTDRITKLERRTKYLPITVIAALFFGCAAGKFLKPDLAVLAVGCGSAGAGMTVAIARQK
ncbi:MAG: hypothetical protein JGK17_06315 [Microcoleus sp. PH2017_10_PVI_O_A]|uniref:hypothetical protein n=1 Tax=unclassified Microcoleus TaxID=2642155 RepID=UPI001DCE0369|nr:MULTISPECIES: hypothetical protein [unclassified Microcoleus]TAE84454.1 MAG: hypothetical protein EAZ83_05720 [Oscillatoriales cyanobacterium]MCC3405201.1 hypothetical protein [Microcoleus sp. PH2017_10_PVI_O_A]MCC3459288.1 hypothetical protein [Microcoleus sp. PH2017_11_PCY_U_A]MCC3477397.1 hypothetical protein [Microcoleus sp. PH2017_12_PCY_D_A]MCC3558490.1 hypothetical protein [Microcoleus sp. PH2017_27_LUM_O_A]